MKLIPAIDVQGGQCVRLFQGRFDDVTHYSDDPAAIAQSLAAFDVRDLHVVDLDGARTGTQQNTDAIRGIAAATSFDVQLGGGLRSHEDLEHWFAAGVRRCVIGSLAVNDPTAVCEWLGDFGGDRIVVALDVVIADDGTPRVATDGWTRTSARSLWDCIDRFAGHGLEHVLCTDVGRDGAMSGPNVTLYRDIMQRYPALALQASGGIRGISDLRELAAHGVPAAISGRAVLDGKITAAEVASLQPNA